MVARIAFLSLLLTTVAALASAQVATTDLTGGTARLVHQDALGLNSTTYTADNPAALAWGAPTHAGGGALKGTVDTGGSDEPDISGKFAGVRAVGGSLAFGAGYLSSETKATGVKTDTTDMDVQLAVPLNDSLSVGAGLSRTKNETKVDVPLPGKKTDEQSRWTAGGSLHFGALYLGAFTGTDSLDTTVEVGGVPASDTAERNVKGYGVALRSERNSWQGYLAYDIVDLDAYYTDGSGGMKLSTATGQAIFGNVMVGYSQGKLDVDQSTDDIKYTTVDVGWVPTQGLSLTARRAELKDTPPSGSAQPETKATTTSVAVNLYF